MTHKQRQIKPESLAPAAAPAALLPQVPTPKPLVLGRRLQPAVLPHPDLHLHLSPMPSCKLQRFAAGLAAAPGVAISETRWVRSTAWPFWLSGFAAYLFPPALASHAFQAGRMYTSKMQKQTQGCHEHAGSQMYTPSRWAQLWRTDLWCSSVLAVMSSATIQLPPDESICGYLLGNNILVCFRVFKKDVTESTRELNTSLYNNNSHS